MKFEDRVDGAILGAMLGDCVANPYLFQKSCELHKKRKEIGWVVNDMSDESLLLSIGLTAIDDNGMRYNALIRAYQQWAKSSPIDIDRVTSLVFGVRERLSARTLWARAPEFDFGALNSASLLVRQIPIVLTAWRVEDENRLMKMIDDVTRLTHVDNQTREACQLYALTLAMALRGASRLHIWDALQKRVKSPQVNEVIIESYYTTPIMDREDSSSNLITLQRVLYELWHGTSFVASIRGCILSGGGTDMNAAAVGAVLGAMSGRDALAQPWVDALFSKYDLELEETLRRAKRIALRSRRQAETDLPASPLKHMTSRLVRHPRYVPALHAQNNVQQQSSAAHPSVARSSAAQLSVSRTSNLNQCVARSSQANSAIKPLDE